MCIKSGLRRVVEPTPGFEPGIPFRYQVIFGPWRIRADLSFVRGFRARPFT
jgi:hypothetical protein